MRWKERGKDSSVPQGVVPGFAKGCIGVRASMLKVKLARRKRFKIIVYINIEGV